ncbi:MAG TPA: MmgE/PrpD family protein [Burkholderiales bacterium]|nr:MmgE/PrpD family protein [Burkholderiales bacterium]
MVLREQAAQGVRALLEWAHGVRLADLPDAARRRTALVIGDDIAAILSAQDEPEVLAFHARLTRSGKATLLRKGAPKVDSMSAAVGNGLAASWNELDEGYRKAPCHAGIYVLPALFAVAEEDGLTVGEAVRAAALGYEIAARFARTWRSTMPPLHPHGIFNAVGAAAGVGLARKLDFRQFILAVTGASTMVSPGPYNHAIQGVLVRNAWAAAGAQTGMLAVELARAGIGGCDASPFDVYASAFHGDTQPEELAAGLGKDWAVCDGYQKLYACCQYAHGSLDALGEILRKRPDLQGGRGVAAIEVETHPLGMTLDNYRPETSLAAKFSLPHALAATMVYGDGGVRAFASASLSDARVSGLRSKVQMKPHPDVRPWPLDRPGRVTVRLESGEQLVAGRGSARGGADQPFAEEEIAAKIQALSASSAPRLFSRLSALNGDASLPFRDWMASIFE